MPTTKRTRRREGVKFFLHYPSPLRLFAPSLLCLTFLFIMAMPDIARADCPLPGYPSYPTGAIILNADYDVLQACRSNGTWIALSPVGCPAGDGCESLGSFAPENCPDVGDVCTGAHAGIIYAGEYAGHKLYVTGTDAPGTVVTGGTGSNTYTWNGGTTSYLDLDNASMPNCPHLAAARDGNRHSDQSDPACVGAQGHAFTAYLAAFAGTGSPYNAASYCYHLGKSSDPAGAGNPLAHGHNDWYLPAVDELEFIYDNLKAGQPAGTHGFQNANYWSSTERTNDQVWYQSFNNGFLFYATKDVTSRRVRCVAR